MRLLKQKLHLNLERFQVYHRLISAISSHQYQQAHHFPGLLPVHTIVAKSLPQLVPRTHLLLLLAQATQHHQGQALVMSVQVHLPLQVKHQHLLRGLDHHRVMVQGPLRETVEEEINFLYLII